MGKTVVVKIGGGKPGGYGPVAMRRETVMSAQEGPGSMSCGRGAA